MGRNHKDFGALLDELLQAEAEPPAPQPTVSFDYLSVAEELHSGRIRVAEEAAMREYRATEANPEAAFEALAAAVTMVQGEGLPSVDPSVIARELGLERLRKAREFNALRREFAFRNHPDRVPPHLRERAIQRMQVANMLIDEAKRRALKAIRD